jgi:hypothetical protein
MKQQGIDSCRTRTFRLYSQIGSSANLQSARTTASTVAQRAQRASASLTRFGEPPRAEPQELRAFGALRVWRCGVPSVPHGAYATHPAGQRDRPERRYRNGDTRNENHLGYVEHLGPVTRIGARRAPNGPRGLMRRRRNLPSRSRQHLDRDGAPVRCEVTAPSAGVHSRRRRRWHCSCPCSRPSDRASQHWPD